MWLPGGRYRRLNLHISRQPNRAPVAFRKTPWVFQAPKDCPAEPVKSRCSSPLPRSNRRHCGFLSFFWGGRFKGAKMPRKRIGFSRTYRLDSPQ